MSIQVTPAAQAHIRQSVSEPRKVRLSLKPSGCAGYSYVFEEAPSQHGDVLQEFPGFLLALPLSELSKLTGLVIDCETGLAGTRMTFHNPHETARCGCGLSVELKEHCA